MDEVVARLKAAAEVESNEDHQKGVKDGERWAKEAATPKQLGRLQEMDNDTDDLLALYDSRTSDNIACGLYRVLFPGENDHWREVEGFWEGVLGEDSKDLIKDLDFTRGFVAGALDVWNKVADKL
jgi:hypothetical protein